VSHLVVYNISTKIEIPSRLTMFLTKFFKKRPRRQNKTKKDINGSEMSSELPDSM
jgi:hypothetical protein